MIIKNYEVEQFGRFLFDLTLRGKQSRMRTRFVKVLQGRLELQIAEREQLVNEFAKRDEKGEIVYQENEAGQEGIVIGDVEEFNKEVICILEEDFIIEETQEVLDMLIEVKNIVLDCDLEFSGDEATQYDRWCEIVEEIN